MISHSEATKPPPRLSKTKLAEDQEDFNFHDVELSYEIKTTNNANALYPKRRSSRLIAQSMEFEKSPNKVNDIKSTKKNHVNMTTSILENSTNQIEHDFIEEDYLRDNEDTNEKVEIVESTSNQRINDEQFNGEINSTFRSGRRKQVFDIEDNNVSDLHKDRKQASNLSTEVTTNKNKNLNEVFGNIRRLFPKTIDSMPHNFNDSLDSPPNLMPNTYRYSLGISENSIFSNPPPYLQKQKPAVNYLTEQALALIANNEKANANKVKQRITRPHIKQSVSKLYEDNEIRGNQSLETAIFSSCDVIKKPLPKVNVVVSRTTNSNFNSSYSKLTEQKPIFNVTNSFRRNNFTTKNTLTEQISQPISMLSKPSNFCRDNLTSNTQQKYKTVTLKSNDINLHKSNNITNIKSIKNIPDSNQSCRVLIQETPKEKSPSEVEKQMQNQNSCNKTIMYNNESQNITQKNLTPTSGRVVVIKSSNTNRQSVPINSEQSKSIDRSIFTVPFISEPGPSGLQSTKGKINQSFALNPVNNKLVKYHNMVNLKRKNITSESNNSSQSSITDQSSIGRHGILDRSPILLKGLKNKVPLNKLREIAMKCFIPRSITLHSLIYKRSRRPYNFTTNKKGKLVMVCSSGKNVIAKGPIEYDILAKMEEIPSLKEFACTDSNELESGLYQTVIVCAYFTSFYSVKMFKIVKRREYYPRSFEALPFYPTKKELDEETATTPKKRKRSKSCEFPISCVNDYLVVYIPVTILKEYGLLNIEGKVDYDCEVIRSPYTPERKVRVSQKIYDSKTKHLNEDNHSDDMEGELKGITVTVEIPPPRKSSSKETPSENLFYNKSNTILSESRTKECYNPTMVKEGEEGENEYDMTPADLDSLPNDKNDLENDITVNNDGTGTSNKKTVRTIYTHPNKKIKDTRGTIIPPNTRRFYNNRDIPDDVTKILDYYKLNREPTIYTEEKIENIRNFGRRMTASYQYLHRIKDMELWNIVDEVKKELKKNEGKNDVEKVPGDNQSNLIQTIKGQVLKRGRGRPRKSETEKTVLEEEIIKRSDEGLSDIKEIDEDCLLSTEDMLIQRENNGYCMDQYLYKDSKEDETTLALASIDNDLPIDKINNDILKRQITNSYGFTLDPMTKDDNDIFSFRESSISNDEYNERRKVIGHSFDGKECYTAIPKEEYPLYKGRCSTLTLVDEMLQKNCSEIGLGVKYHTLKEMEINEYDKVPKTEEAIYGPRPNAYTRFIEENKDMFMNDCSLRYVFDEMGQIRKFPLFGDDNNIPRSYFDREESSLYDNDSLDGDIGIKSYQRYNGMFGQNDLYDEEENDSLQSDDDEEEFEDEEDNNMYSNQIIRSKQSSLENYQNKFSLQHRFKHSLNGTIIKQRKQRIGKPRGPYMTKKRRLEALKAAQGLLNASDENLKSKRPVGRPKGSTKRRYGSSTPVDPATISLGESSIFKKSKTDDIYCRPTFNSILASSRCPTEYSKTKLRQVR